MTKKRADWAKEESSGDTQDILNRLKEAAETDHYWCELSSYSSSLLWQELERRLAVEPAELRCPPLPPNVQGLIIDGKTYMRQEDGVLSVTIGSMFPYRYFKITKGYLPDSATLNTKTGKFTPPTEPGVHKTDLEICEMEVTETMEYPVSVRTIKETFVVKREPSPEKPAERPFRERYGLQPPVQCKCGRTFKIESSAEGYVKSLECVCGKKISVGSDLQLLPENRNKP